MANMVLFILIYILKVQMHSFNGEQMKAFGLMIDINIVDSDNSRSI